MSGLMGESQSDLIMHLTPVGCKDEFLKQNLFKILALKLGIRIW